MGRLPPRGLKIPFPHCRQRDPNGFSCQRLCFRHFHAKRDILVGVDNSSQVNLPSLELGLEHGGHSTQLVQNCLPLLPNTTGDKLGRIGRINNNRLLGRLVCHQIGIVIAFSGPWKAISYGLAFRPLGRLSFDRRYIHMGIECTCMALDCSRVGARRTENRVGDKQGRSPAVGLRAVKTLMDG